ncbi:MAG: hypothetical protein AB8G05_00540 [Oligoflexales bacterium]
MKSVLFTSILRAFIGFVACSDDDDSSDSSGRGHKLRDLSYNRVV